MTSPRTDLLRRFGTEEVYQQKLAGMPPLAARLAIGAFNVARNQAERDRQDFLYAQAEEMNRQLAQTRAMLMRPVERNLEHTHAPMILSAGRSPGMMSGLDVPVGMDEGMIRLASAAGVAIESLEELEKDAGIVGDVAKRLSTGAGSLVKKIKTPSLGSEIRAFERRQSGKLTTRLNQFERDRARGVLKPADSISSELKAHQKELFDKRMARKAEGAAIPAPAKPAAGQVPPPPAAKPASGVAPQQVQPSVAPATPAGQVQPPSAPPAAQPAQPTAPAAGQVQPPTSQAAGQAASAAAAPQKPGFWDRTGLSNNRWKTKLPLLAAGGLGMYGLYRGAKWGLDELGREPAPYQHNQGGAMPAMGVNEYGQPDRNVPMY